MFRLLRHASPSFEHWIGHHQRGRWGDGPPPFGAWFGGGPRWGAGNGASDRPFGRGDLKYVILSLLAEQPRHGYDVMRALGERFHGFYTPSAGTVYPTLQMLEDQGLLTSQDVGGKRVYTITEEGRRFLTERGDTMEDLRARVGAWWDGATRSDMADLMREVAELGRLLFARGPRAGWSDPAKLKRIRAVIARTRDEIDAILKETPSDVPPGGQTPPVTHF